MAHYKLGYGGTAGLEQTIYDNLKIALANYSDKITITTDDENLTVTLHFKTLGSYVKIVSTNGTYAYQQVLQINFYDVNDTEIYSTMNKMFVTSAATSFIFLDVLELQGNGLIFGARVGADSDSSYNDMCFAFVDDTTNPIIIFPARVNNTEFKVYKNDDTSLIYTLGTNNLYLSAFSSTSLQLCKFYDSTEDTFFNNLYHEVVGVPTFNANELKLATVGDKKFYLWNPNTQTITNYSRIALECTDKFIN